MAFSSPPVRRVNDEDGRNATVRPSPLPAPTSAEQIYLLRIVELLERLLDAVQAQKADEFRGQRIVQEERRRR